MSSPLRNNNSNNNSLTQDDIYSTVIYDATPYAVYFGSAQGGRQLVVQYGSAVLYLMLLILPVRDVIKNFRSSCSKPWSESELHM